MSFDYYAGKHHHGPQRMSSRRTSATLNHTFLTPLFARLSPRLSCKPLTTASGTNLHASTSLDKMLRKQAYVVTKSSEGFWYVQVYLMLRTHVGLEQCAQCAQELADAVMMLDCQEYAAQCVAVSTC